MPTHLQAQLFTIFYYFLPNQSGTAASPWRAVPVPDARRVAGRDPRSASEPDRSGAAPRGQGLGPEQQEVMVITG